MCRVFIQYSILQGQDKEREVIAHKESIYGQTSEITTIMVSKLAVRYTLK